MPTVVSGLRKILSTNSFVARKLWYEARAVNVPISFF